MYSYSVLAYKCYSISHYYVCINEAHDGVGSWNDDKSDRKLEFAANELLCVCVERLDGDAHHTDERLVGESGGQRLPMSHRP